MGYTTSFNGAFEIKPPLKPEHKAFLDKLNETRRMKRNPAVCEQRPDPIRVAAGLPIGEDAEFFVGEDGVAGQGEEPPWKTRADLIQHREDVQGILDYNESPGTQPGLWCQWVPNEDGTELVWDDGEKFYSYVEWLEYLIEKLFKPWGYTLNGDVQYQGEDSDDRGSIVVTDNVVDSAADDITNPLLDGSGGSGTGETLWLVFIWGDVSPEVEGPYKTIEERDAAARKMRADEGEEHGIFKLTVDANGKPEVEEYSGAFFGDDEEAQGE